MRKFPFYDLKEFKVFRKLNSPKKIQDFIDGIPINFSDTYKSPLEVLRRNKIQCFEGAVLAASILWYQKRFPLILELRTSDNHNDQNHVITLFKERNCWGAISKTNHAVLRYRDPIYKNVRELVMSYFNEYFLDNGEKTLCSYSKPVNLLGFDDNWIISKNNLWNIWKALDRSSNIKIFEKNMRRHLRKADKIEIEAGKLVQWKKPLKNI